jgi:hypothetical protein
MKRAAIIAAIGAMVALCNTGRAQQPLPLPEYAPADFANKSIIFYGSALSGVQAYAGFPQSGLTSTGTTQAGAYDLTTSPTGQVVVFADVPAGSGVAVNANFPVGGWQVIVNEGTNPLLAYPPIGGTGTIDGGAANAPISVLKSAVLQLVAPGDWRSIGSGGGTGGSGIPATALPLCGSGTAGTAQACVSLAGLATGGGSLAVVYGTTANTALEGSLRGAPSGVAQLDGGGLIPLSELPTLIAAMQAVLCGTGATNGAVACSPLVGLTSTAGGLAVVYGTAANTALEGSLLGAASGVAPLDAGARVPYANLPVAVQTVGLTFGFGGVPAASTLRQQVLPYACNVPANLAGSETWENTLATGSPAFAAAYVHSGSTTAIGTIVCSSSLHTCTLPSSSAANLVAGDVVQVTSPGSPDASAADLTFTVVCARQ